METLKHKSYIDILLDLEETVLTIDEIIQKLENHCLKLGQKTKIAPPVKKQVKSQETSSAGWIAGFVSAGLVAFVMIVLRVTDNSSDLSDIVTGFFSGMFIGALAGVFIGLIVNALVKNRLNQDAQKEANKEYHLILDRYNEAVSTDEKRVDRENKQKVYIYGQIKILNEKRIDTISVAEQIYKIVLIPSEYWHNVSALSYFNQYYGQQLVGCSVKEMTEVYNYAFLDYEDNKKSGLIVSSQDIISADDYSIKKQRDLFRLMKNLHNVSSFIAAGVISESLINATVDKEMTVFKFIEEKKEMEKDILQLFN